MIQTVEIYIKYKLAYSELLIIGSCFPPCIHRTVVA